MASSPKQRVFSITESGADANFTDIPCTICCRRMTIQEMPLTSGGSQVAFVPQGIQYQLWDKDAKAWGPTVQLQAVAGAQIVIETPIPQGTGSAAPIGWPKQSDHFGQVRAADIPVRVMSGTATATSIVVNEYA